MLAAYLPRQLEAEIEAFAKDVRASEHKGTAVKTDDYERKTHVFGAYGNSDRAAFGYNQTEAKALRSILRKAGYTLPLDAVEGLLAEALARLDGSLYHDTMSSDRQKRLEDSKRQGGLCVRCPKYIARPALPGRTLCDDCMAKETARVADYRKRRRLEKALSAVLP